MKNQALKNKILFLLTLGFLTFSLAHLVDKNYDVSMGSVAYAGSTTSAPMTISVTVPYGVNLDGTEIAEDTSFVRTQETSSLSILQTPPDFFPSAMKTAVDGGDTENEAVVVFQGSKTDYIVTSEQGRAGHVVLSQSQGGALFVASQTNFDKIQRYENQFHSIPSGEKEAQEILSLDQCRSPGMSSLFVKINQDSFNTACNFALAVPVNTQEKPLLNVLLTSGF